MDDLKQLIPPALAAQARRLRQLTAVLYRLLPGELAAHCEVIGFEQGTLTIGVESPAWQTRLRFVENEICRCWPPSEGRVEQVRVKVTVPVTETRRIRHAPAPLSPEAAEAVRRTARHVGHAGLAAALLRLAQRAGGGNTGKN